MEQGPGTGDYLSQVGELLDLDAGEGVGDRQVVGGVGELHRRVGAELGDGLLDSHLGLGDDGRGATDRALGDVAAHQASVPPPAWSCP